MSPLFRKERLILLRSLLLSTAALTCAGHHHPAAAQSLPYTTVRPAVAQIRSLPFNTVAGPRSTHRFWAAKNWFPTNLADSSAPYTMFAEPLAFQSTPAGLLVGYSPRITVSQSYFIHPWQPAFTLGVEGMHVKEIAVSGNSDWSVDLNFGSMTSRIGRGMPFVYAIMNGRNPTITFATPPIVFSHAGSVLGVSAGDVSYGLFCPTGGWWTQTPTVFTCHLPPGKNYFSAALLPQPDALSIFQQHAYSFPMSTRVSWSYDEQTSQVSTVYEVTTKDMEGATTGFLQALYPHQYASLAGSQINTSYTYTSARGTMKVLDGKAFTTRDTYHGVLPLLPLPRSPELQQELQPLLRQVRAEQTLFAARDTYGVGRELGRIAQLLPVAEMAKDDGSFNFFKTAMKAEFGEWFGTAAAAGLPTFFYDRDWGTMIGYPASYGSDEQLNDHHFHYGYWIHAAALLGLYDPEWLQSRDGAGIAMLARDIASPTRDDPMFPFLRHFDVYAGHSWASGQAPFGDGENEESSSEATNAWAGIILFASETNDRRLRDAAIWMYTLETNAAFDYWFNDGPVKTFPQGYTGVQIANLFDGKSDAATWFGNAPAMEHGIQFLPFTGASLYLGRDPEYVRRSLAEVTRSSSGHVDTASSSWPDLMELYEGFDDPEHALGEWKQTAYVNEGETRAHEYAWLKSLEWLGTVDISITANTPLYAVFRSKTGAINHVAFNASQKTIQVVFSDGFHALIPPVSLSVNQLNRRVGHS